MARAKTNKAYNPELQEQLEKGRDAAMNRKKQKVYTEDGEKEEYHDKVWNGPPEQGDPTDPGSERIDWMKIPRR